MSDKRVIEADVEQYLKNKIHRMGGKCLKFESPGTAGVPDRVIITPNNMTVFAETKSPRGKLRPLQKAVIGDMVKSGAVVLCLKSKKEVMDFILELEDGTYSTGNEDIWWED